MKKNTAFTLLTATAFAAAAAKPATAGATSKPAADRIAPLFTDVRTDVARPTNGRRSKSELADRCAALETIGASFGLQNKTKKQISSALSKINNAAGNFVQAKDAAGNLRFEPGAPIKDANGAVVSEGRPVAVMEKVREFTAYDVDAKSDPDKATVRIFRDK